MDFTLHTVSLKADRLPDSIAREVLRRSKKVAEHLRIINALLIEHGHNKAYKITAGNEEKQGIFFSHAEVCKGVTSVVCSTNTEPVCLDREEF